MSFTQAFFFLHQYVFASVAPPFLSSLHGFHPWVVGSWPSAAALSLCHGVLFFFFYKDGKMKRRLQMLHVGCERHSSWNGFYTDPYLQHGKGDRHTLMAVFQSLWVPGELLLLPGSSAHVGTCRAGPCVGAQGCTVSQAAGLQEQEIGSWNSEQHQSTPFFLSFDMQLQ